MKKGLIVLIVIALAGLSRLKAGNTLGAQFFERNARGPVATDRSGRAGPEALQSKGPAGFRGAHGRYKTRTCDLHDVNVAL